MSVITDIDWRPSVMTKVELRDIVLNEYYWGFVIGHTARQVKIQLVENEVIRDDRDSKVVKPKWESLGDVVIAKYYKGNYRCWCVKMKMGIISMLSLYTGDDKECTVYYHD